MATDIEIIINATNQAAAAIAAAAKDIDSLGAAAEKSGATMSRVRSDQERVEAAYIGAVKENTQREIAARNSASAAATKAGADMNRVRNDQERAEATYTEAVKENAQREIDARERAGEAMQRFALVAAAALVVVGKKAWEFTQEATVLAARVETLGVVTEVMGRNAGYSADEIHKLEKAIQAQGITTQVSRQAIATMIQGEIDLAHATDLARLAQDAAVIGNTNSSEALERLSLVIATGNTLMARRMGLMVDFEGAYQAFADSTGRSSDSLTELEKVGIRTNEVLAQGVNIADAYTAAQETAGGAAKSFARVWEEFQLSLGVKTQESYGFLIDGATTVVDLLGQMYNAENALKTARDEGTISMSEYHKQMNVLRLNTTNTAVVTEFLAKRQEELDAITGQGAKTYKEYLTQQLEVTHAAGIYNEATDMLALAQDGVITLTQEQADALGILTEIMWLAEKATESNKDATNELAWADEQRIEQMARVAGLTERVIGVTAEYTQHLKDNAAANRASRDAAEEAQVAHEAMIDAIDRDIGSPLENFIKDMKWFIATGGEFEAAFTAIQEGVKSGIMTPEVGASLAESLVAPFYAASVEAGNIEFDDAAQGIADALGVPLETAEEMLIAIGDMPAALEAVGATEFKIDSLEYAALTAADYLKSLQMASGQWFAQVHTTYTSYGAPGGPGSSAQPPGVPGQTPPPRLYTPPLPPLKDRLAAGGDYTVPPGYNNDSWIVGLTSGEHVAVTPPGAKTRGGDTYNNTYTDYSVTNVNNPLAAAMLSAQKNAAREMRFDTFM